MQRPNEALVVGQLIDAPVRLTDPGGDDGGKDAVVVDAAVEHTRSRDWVVGRLAVRERRGRLGRRGQAQIVAWGAVTGLTLTDRQGTAGLLAVLETMRPADVASTLSELPEKRRHEVVDALDDERLADVFEEMSESEQRALVAHVGADRAADVLEAMAPDDAADLLERAARRRRRPAARLDGARRVRAGAATAALRLGHRGRPHDAGAHSAASRRHGRRGAGSHPQPRHPARAGQHGLRLPPTHRVPRPGATSAACTPSGCSGRPRSSWWRASSTPAWRPCRPRRAMGELTRYFAAYNLVAGPVVDEGNTCSARSPSTTCSTTCSPWTGATT